MANIMADWWKEFADKNKSLTGRIRGASVGSKDKTSRSVRGTTPVSTKPKTTSKPSSTPTNVSTSTTRDSVRDLDLQRTSALKTKTAKTTPKATTTAKSGTTKLTKSTSGKSSLPAMRAAEEAKLSQKEKTYMKPLKEKNVKKPLPSKDPKAIREDYKAPLRKMGSNNPYVKDLLKRLKEKK